MWSCDEHSSIQCIISVPLQRKRVALGKQKAILAVQCRHCPGCRLNRVILCEDFQHK